MRKITALLTLIPLMAPVASAYGGYFDSGNELFSHCTAREADELHYLKTAECRGYITGVVDHVLLWREVVDEPDCLPEGVNKGQLVAVVVQYLTNHPEERHRAANVLVMRAVTDAFCPKS
jgi:hypothetical protein